MSANSLLKIFFVTMSAASLFFAGCSQQKTSELNTNPATTNPNTVEVQQSTTEIKPIEKDPDAEYIPTPQGVVEQAMRIAKVGKDDIVYDLGSGDGRIPITAAKKFGARGTGIEIDPQLVKKSNENAKKEGVTDKVKFLQQDIFKSNFSDATVVFLYLGDDINIKLRPQLFKQLKPGTRVVSLQHHMGDWVDYERVEYFKCNPEDTCSQEDRCSQIYMWTIPANVPADL
ncbi:MAG: methyltransferase domain-containing protein [Nostoc sp. DedQUE12b]|uniref:SAM-dependent methyltransferase n=1 Tax=Nostoc sp. DedQUE12b TaxID=3075398 RepID=UPI002AD500C7|nr:methyltransferase domain-containing protein [Nostoc sp. DedQUE12b]MDZ8084248.1 methyltransferase domain-containing protein [Nostoc sp. DedQUE12b]